MVKLYDHNLKEEDIDRVRGGDVIVYNDGTPGNSYLIVSSIDTERKIISEQVAEAVGVNCIPLEELVENKK